ncbi:hypothetical protein L873DRAFT_914909 [Choiromyces venosus 120613-1]|uniref:Uncharacterized protein n=1 Tax=Choiromyces venosus 120613-1 TaxID=1336337 RepID=A0A3N4JM16_9PEZI|nr:hypothetical protein L873DRAFT_914909 [Choiromyces venosus 120613-1]
MCFYSQLCLGSLVCHSWHVLGGVHKIMENYFCRSRTNLYGEKGYVFRFFNEPSEYSTASASRDTKERKSPCQLLLFEPAKSTLVIACPPHFFYFFRGMTMSNEMSRIILGAEFLHFIPLHLMLLFFCTLLHRAELIRPASDVPQSVVNLLTRLNCVQPGRGAGWRFFLFFFSFF